MSTGIRRGLLVIVLGLAESLSGQHLRELHHRTLIDWSLSLITVTNAVTPTLEITDALTVDILVIGQGIVATARRLSAERLVGEFDTSILDCKKVLDML